MQDGEIIINHYEGTVFNTPAKTIVNTVNWVQIMAAQTGNQLKI